MYKIILSGLSTNGNSTHVMPKYHGDICYILLTQRPTLGWPCNKQAPPYSSFYSLSKQLEQSRNSLPLIPPCPPSKERQSSQPSSPLHTYRSSSNKEVSFNSSQALVPNLKLE